MEFTCLWSKDAQQKKRKRWMDGVARFSPATGVLSIWDQDVSTKVSSTRLKPDEADAVLQEDGDETRLGSISVQVMADISAQRRQEHPGGVQDAGTAAATPSKIPPVDGEAVNSSRPGRPSAVGSGIRRGTLGVTRKLGSGKPGASCMSAAGKLGTKSTLGVAGSSLPGTTAGDLAGGSSNGTGSDSVGAGPSQVAAGSSTRAAAVAATTATATTATSTATAAIGGAIKKRGLGGAGRGVGGARRFHAPRPTSRPAAVMAATVPAASSVASASGSQQPGRARLVGNESNAGPIASARGLTGFTGAGRGGGGAAGGAVAAAAVADPEGVVLEWTAGDPPQPVMAGASLARRLHPHQREGLKVLWECLAGRGGYDGRGAILADEMGLGKSATAIALCTCVLRHRRAECKKAVVVCPSSLVGNWANEFRKWCPLGGGAVAVKEAGAAAAQLVSDFKIGSATRYPILIISYELYRNHGKVINATEGLGLLIADEGHRLKNSAETKTTRALKACPAVMRLVLTGTPMQNDLDEFFAVADFVNPGLLGSLKSFRSRYTRPMKAAWDREADEDVSDLAAERTRELGEITEKFVLRRTKDVIRGSLPAALEVVVFCRPSQRQLSAYEGCIARSEGARSLLYGDEEGGGEGKGRGARGWEADSEEDDEADAEDEGFYMDVAEEAGEGEDVEGEGEGEGEGAAWVGRGGKKRRRQRSRRVGLQGVLPLISTLRRLCNHPDLVVGKTGCTTAADSGGGSGGGIGGRVSGDEGKTLRGEARSDDSGSGAENAEDGGGGDILCDGLDKENNTSLVTDAATAAVTVTAPGGRKGSAWKVPRANRVVAAEASKAAAGTAGRGREAREAAAEPAAAAATPRYESVASGKVLVLEALLKAVRREYPGDKVVVSSNFTSALDVLGALAGRNAWGFLRLDGGTPTNARQSMVDRFNKAPPDDLFLFFLSAKAGGVGLNLVGANRIVLFDSDWNPATDDQAMARVWRLGQTKEVSMYRLLSTGTLEENIYQRQIFKGALYDLIHDSNDPSKENGQGCTDADGDDNHSSERSSGRGKVGRSGRSQQRERMAGVGESDGTVAAAAAAMTTPAKETGARSSKRGFSQEELKELFVLKTGTRSDTFDKLRRGLPPTTAGSAAMVAVAATEPPAFGRYGRGRAGEEAGERSVGESPAGGAAGAAAGALDVADEAWEDYGGPSQVLDKALRLALLDGAARAETPAGSGGGGDTSASDDAGGDSAAGGVVTFVREVKRGGRAGQQRRSGGGEGSVARSPFVALEGV